MKSKVIKNSLFGLVGILVIFQLFKVFSVLFHGFLFRSFFKIGIIIVIIVILLGFVIGVRAADRKTLFYKIFQPTTQNLLLALVISILLLTYSSRGFHAFFAIKILIMAISFYPFAALSIFTINNWNKNPIKKYRVWAIIAIILLSPTLASSNVNFSKTNFHQQQLACGAYVYGFPENSPANASGMQIGEIINEIEGKEIKSLRDVKDITYPLTEETELSVVTNKGSYEITTYFDEVKNKQRIGVNVWQQTCGKQSSKFHKFSWHKRSYR